MLSVFRNLFTAGNSKKLKEAIAAGGILIDVRSAAEFASGNIKSSVNIPLDRLGAQVHVLKKDKPVIVFCRSGARSSVAKSILEKKGFVNIVNGGSITTVNNLINTK